MIEKHLHKHLGILVIFLYTENRKEHIQMMLLQKEQVTNKKSILQEN